MPDERDSTPPSKPESDPAGLEALLDYLHRSRGFDFTGYKRTSLARRIERRMQLVSTPTYAEYTDYLEVHPDEFPQLFNTVLINVTTFFRDSAAWEALAGEVKKLVAARRADRAIRVWSAGCASGEEAYTLAMILVEAVGLEDFAKRVKIYATDIDEEALAHARQATYSQKAIEGVPPALLEKYFTRSGASYVFSKELRRAVIFGRHDLVHDAPISRVDVLACRNTLMYFNAETQKRILARLHFALADDGVLFLGKAEMLLTHNNLFMPVDLKLRIFTRAPRTGKTRDRVPLESATNGDYENGNGNGNGNGHPNGATRLRQAVFDASPIALVVIDGGGRIALVNNHAAHAFALTAHDIGRPFQDIELSYRPVELRSFIDQARTEKRPVHVREVERSTGGGEKTYFDITVTPLFDERLDVIGTQVSFADVTHYHRLQLELRKTNAELETAHEELQSTSEELETTNEELQSTVEELETTNEELQSTNEELETMNEELQSTNEELQTMNDELRQRGEEVNQVNAFFSSILASLYAGVAVLDRDLVVKAWNHKMEDLWGLRTDEVTGKHFLNLDMGLAIDELAVPIRACVAGDAKAERTLEATNRRGKKITVKVSVTPLRGEANRGVIVLIEEEGA